MKNRFGFSLVELLVSMGLLSGSALALMYVSKQQGQVQNAIMAESELVRIVHNFGRILSIPEVCRINFEGKAINASSGLTEVVSTTGEALIATVPTPTSTGYHLKEILIGAHDSIRKRTEIQFRFELHGDALKSKNRIETFQLYSESTGALLTRCLSPGEIIGQSLVEKMCEDVDPTGVGDCSQNLVNTVNDVKMNLCQASPHLTFSGGVCQPLDAGKFCPTYMKGYDANGNLVCL